jgi:hypothetical protein
VSKANEISEMIRRLPQADKQRLIDLIWLLYRAPAAARDAAIVELEATLHANPPSARFLRKVESVIADLQRAIDAGSGDGGEPRGDSHEK